MPGRSPTELSILEAFKRQMFVLLYVLNWRPFSKVTDFFNQLLEEMSKITGCHLQVPPKQWQGRKEKWDKEWSIGHGGPSRDILSELAKLSLWYDGTTEIISLPPVNKVALPQMASSRYYRRQHKQSHRESGSVESQTTFEGHRAIHGMPSDLVPGSCYWPSEPMQPSTDCTNLLPCPDIGTHNNLGRSMPLVVRQGNQNMQEKKDYLQAFNISGAHVKEANTASNPYEFLPRPEHPAPLRSDANPTSRPREKASWTLEDTDQIY